MVAVAVMADIFNERILPDFLNKLKSADSVRAYRRSCSYISEYCAKGFLSLNDDDVRNYAQSLMQHVMSGKYSSAYASAEFARIRSVASYIEDNSSIYEIHYLNPFDGYAFPAAGKSVEMASLPRIDAINILLDKVAGDDELFLGITLILRCSLTTGECIGIKRSDFIIEDDAMLLQITKRGYTRHLVLPDDVRDIINQYVSSHDSSSGALLINSQNEPLRLRAFQKRFEKKAAECGFGYSMNDIRNAGITYMLACGSSAPETARYLGINERWAYRYTGAAQKLNIVSDDYSNIRVVRN